MIEPLSPSILAIVYLGDVVFAVSGAATAMRYRMDIIGVLLIGLITGLGGGTLRDVLIGRPVFWTRDVIEIVLCLGAAGVTFFFLKSDVLKRRGMVWGDAVGLAAFSVGGAHIALMAGMNWLVAILMGMITATGGGVIRDVITNTQPIITSGQIYATAALLGACAHIGLVALDLPSGIAEFGSFAAALTLRGLAIRYDIRMGPVDRFLTIRKGK